MLITQKDIRIAFDTLKELKAIGHSYQLHNEVEREQPAIYKAIIQDQYRKIINNERFTLYEFACIVYLVFKHEYGIIQPIDYNALLENIELNKTIDTFNNYLTDCDLLEDYLKPIIHANEFIKPKNVNLCICMICAIISQYQISSNSNK